MIMGVTCFNTKCYAMKTNDYIAHFRDLFNENSTLFVFIVIINYLEHQKVQYDCHNNDIPKSTNK